MNLPETVQLVSATIFALAYHIVAERSLISFHYVYYFRIRTDADSLGEKRVELLIPWLWKG
jgi:hypothetical protein